MLAVHPWFRKLVCVCVCVCACACVRARIHLCVHVYVVHTFTAAIQSALRCLVEYCNILQAHVVFYTGKINMPLM